MRFYKTTVTIYSPYPGDQVELTDLARDADRGDSICTDLKTVEVTREQLPQDAASFLLIEEEG